VGEIGFPGGMTEWHVCRCEGKKNLKGEVEGKKSVGSFFWGRKQTQNPPTEKRSYKGGGGETMSTGILNWESSNTFS